MIHHLSIAVSNPLRVAQVLAELMQGKLFEFIPNPDSYRVAAQDDFGTGIEVYPFITRHTILTPLRGQLISAEMQQQRSSR